MIKKVKKTIAALTLACTLAISFTGCYGSFPLVKSVYNFNGQMGKFPQQLVFYCFAIIPVYGGAGFVDIVVFNLIEFWSGEAMETASMDLGDGTELVLSPTDQEDMVTISLTRDGAVLQSGQLLRVSDSVLEARDADGTVTGRILRDSEGMVSFENPEAILVAQARP